jgi:hypothetical protein
MRGEQIGSQWYEIVAPLARLLEKAKKKGGPRPAPTRRIDLMLETF